MPDSTTAAARQFETGLRLTPVLARLLAQRGWSDLAAVTEFLFPRLEHTHSPWLMRGMSEAAARLLAAGAAGEAVMIVGDYDVDGTMAVVILRQALGAVGVPVTFRLPHRLEEGYGIPGAALDEAVAAGIGLIVTVDTGIREIATLERARELGLEVIVTDHHLPAEKLPPALAILNPHQPGCGYPDKGLCGTGIAFKLVQALLERAGKLEGAWPPRLQAYLKLVALGTIADAVPLLGENRVLARFGLAGLVNPVNAGLKALVQAALPQAQHEGVRASDVAFRLAPRLNAAGRLGPAGMIVDLFSAGPEQAATIVATLEKLNRERQQLCEDVMRAAEAQCADPAIGGTGVLVVAGENWHRGVLGIVAGRLLERTGKPTLVAGLEAGPDGALIARGSGRAPAGFHLLQALSANDQLFHRYGGHAQAVGFTLPAANLAALRQALPAPSTAASAGRRRVDLTITLADLTPELTRDLQRLEPCGEANPEPVFRLERARLEAAPAIMKEKHLKLRIEQQGRRAEAVAWHCWREGKWNPGAGWPEFSALEAGAELDLEFRVQFSRHPQYGERTQLVVQGLALSAATAAVATK